MMDSMNTTTSSLRSDPKSTGTLNQVKSWNSYVGVDWGSCIGRPRCSGDQKKEDMNDRLSLACSCWNGRVKKDIYPGAPF